MSLDLSVNRIGSDGAVALEELKCCTNLKTLVLRSNGKSNAFVFQRKNDN